MLCVLICAEVMVAIVMILFEEVKCLISFVQSCVCLFLYDENIKLCDLKILQ